MGSEFYEGEIFAHMGSGTQNVAEQFMMEYLSWDVIQRECQPKFGPEIPQFIKNEDHPFFKQNSYLYSAPFIIFYKKLENSP